MENKFISSALSLMFGCLFLATKLFILGLVACFSREIWQRCTEVHEVSVLKSRGTDIWTQPVWTAESVPTDGTDAFVSLCISSVDIMVCIIVNLQFLTAQCGNQGYAACRTKTQHITLQLGTFILLIMRFTLFFFETNAFEYMCSSI